MHSAQRWSHRTLIIVASASHWWDANEKPPSQCTAVITGRGDRSTNCISESISKWQCPHSTIYVRMQRIWNSTELTQNIRTARGPALSSNGSDPPPNFVQHFLIRRRVVESARMLNCDSNAVSKCVSLSVSVGRFLHAAMIIAKWTCFEKLNLRMLL